MKILIVGAGAIGRLFGALLSRGGNDVILLEKREEVVSAINRNGIGLLEFGVEDPDAVTIIPVRATTNAAEITACDLVILAVKSFDTREALAPVAHLASTGSAFLTVQTGIGNIRVMESLVPKNAILGGYTFMAATELGVSHVKHGGAGKTVIGELDGSISDRIRSIADTFTACGIETEISPSIHTMIWKKVIVLSAINPLTALLQVPNGFLLEHMESVSLMKRLIDEAAAAAEARSIVLRVDELYDTLFETLKRTAGNLSSMLQDILEERRTEIDSQNGAICRYARERGLPACTHETIVDLVRLAEKHGRRE